MSRILASLRATVLGVLAFSFLFLVGTPLVLLALWQGRIDTLYHVARRFLAFALWLGGIRIEVRGLENVPKDRACVYMANHQSNADPPILFVSLPPRIAFMGKKQVFSIPVLRTAMRLADFVAVHRENPEEARASVEEALEKLQRGVTFLVYPEGTRSWDGRVGRFKHGVFLLAIRAGAPIVPVTLDGATEVMPKGRWEFYPGEARVTIHPPIETRGRMADDRRRLAEEVRATVVSALSEELRGPAAAPAVAAPELDDRL